MSRYIDLDLYHRVERSHPFYEEMINAILEPIRYQLRQKPSLKILEFGAGTGLLTGELIKHERVIVDALELDEKCCEIHRKYIIDDNHCRCICGDAVTFCQKGGYDIVVSAFAHDHISYEFRNVLSQNIKNNLKPNGLYIMGGEIIPFF